MDGWIDGWMDGWMDGWIDGWMDGLMDEWTDGWIERQFIIAYRRMEDINRLYSCFTSLFKSKH